MRTILVIASLLALYRPTAAQVASPISVDSVTLSVYTEYVHFIDTLDNNAQKLSHRVTKALIVLKGISDLNQITAFEIALGSGMGQSDLVYREFNMDEPLLQTPGLAFFRDHQQVVLSLGFNHPETPKYCRLRLKNTAGAYSSPVVFFQ